MKRRIPAVILGDSPTSLYATRELSASGVEVYVEPTVSTALAYSNSVTKIPVNSTSSTEEDRLDVLLNAPFLSSEFRAFLLPCSDQDIAFVSRYSEELKAKYVFPRSIADGSAEKLMDKDQLSDLCGDNGVEIPFCQAVSGSGLSALADVIEFPCLVKPSLIHIVKSQMNGKKLWVIRGSEELRELEKRLPVGDTDWLVQEVVPGPESNIWLYAAYFDSNGCISQRFTARKCRQYPPGFGSASFVVSEDNPELTKICDGFFSSMEYRGVVTAEFKYDERSSSFKMIEVNPRPSLWFGITTASNKKLCVACYDDLINGESACDGEQIQGVRWRYVTRDIFSAWFYKLNKNFILPPPRIPSKNGPVKRAFAVYQKNDLAPFFADIFISFRKLVQRVLGRKDN